jgi:crotonobetainyl-CoA:carnitine CoA-transferase CaiB-like acyl-CoA transferase
VNVSDLDSSGSEPQVLDDLRVIDLSRWIAGEYATKLFADFGADVIKVETPRRALCSCT